ncbi:MAG: GNAT family N-acetyltransferase [bacterium]|nr:GNAT family N-acetyltransferase [bacterium]
MEFRPAGPADADRVRDICRDIWEGRDYLMGAIDRWIAEGGVYVGVVEGEVVGLSRIKRLGADDWWLEGLRVAPGSQGKGYGKLLHRAIMEELRRRAHGVVRFCTADTNRSVPLARRDGFLEILNLPFLDRSYGGESLGPLEEALTRHGAREAKLEEPGLAEFLLKACRGDYAGLLPQGWHHRTATARTMEEELAGARILVRGEAGAVEAALVVNPSTQYDEDLDLDLVAGPAEAVAQNLLPWLGPLAVEMGRTDVGGAVPERFVGKFLAAGFRIPEGFTRQMVFELRLP